MAVDATDSAEWIIEEAWLTALTANADLLALVSVAGGGGIQRAQDYSHGVAYPIVLVDSMEAMDDPESSPLDGNYIAEVILDGRTSKDADETGRAVNKLKRGIRNVLETAGLKNTLETVGNLKVYGVVIQDEQLSIDTEEVRARGLVVKCHFTVENLPEP